MIHWGVFCVNLDCFELLQTKVIMEHEEDIVQICTDPREQNDGIWREADTQQRSHTFEEAVNVLIESSNETHFQIRDMKESFQTLTSQLISVVSNLSDIKKSNQ